MNVLAGHSIADLYIYSPVHFHFSFLLLLMLTRLDYPGVGPEHSFLKDLGRAEYYSITDEEALEGEC